MSSDDDSIIPHTGNQRQRGSLASPVPPSAGGLGPESPKFNQDDANNINDPDQRGPMNGDIPMTATEIANSDEKVRQVVYSDVHFYIPSIALLIPIRSV
jgi:hypothetical protein